MYCLAKLLGDEIWIYKWHGRYSLWMMEESMVMAVKSFVTPTLFLFATNQKQKSDLIFVIVYSRVEYEIKWMISG